MLVGSGHGSETSVHVEGVSVVEGGLLGKAVGWSDGVSSDTWDGGLRVWNDNTVLDVVTLDLVQVTVGSSIVSQELGDNGERLGGVDSHARAVEGGVTHTVRVEITSIGISWSSVTRSGVGTTASVAVTSCLGDVGGGVRGESSRDGVGFPDIHLSTA